MIVLVLLALRLLLARFRRLSKRSVATILSLCIVLSAKAGSQPMSSQDPSAILKKSYALGKRLHGPERTAYLVALTRVSASIDPESSRRWSEELFALASRSPLDWDHVALQKNAAVSLAPIDPARALEMLTQVDEPQPDPDGRYPEDVRADAAVHIFPWFWGKYGLRRLAQIQFAAKDIGDTGEYPYRAMSKVIDELIDLHFHDADVEAEAIFRQAVVCYRRHSKFSNNNEEFFEMLGSAGRINEPDVYREALELFIANVSVPDSGVAYASNVRTAQGTLRLNDHNQQLLWRVVPYVLHFDPGWADKLVAQRPELKQAEGGVVPLGETYISGNHSGEDLETRQQRLLEKALLSRITSLNEADPHAARQMALSLATLPARISAIAIVLPEAKRCDPAQANQIYELQLSDLRQTQDPQDRLEALVAVSKSAFVMQDQVTFHARTREAMETGVVLFETDSKKARAKLRNGYLGLAELVEFAAQHNVDWVIARARHTRSRLLKAHLLIFVAKGLAERNTTSSTPKGECLLAELPARR